MHLAASARPWSLQNMPPASASSHAVDDDSVGASRLSNLVTGFTGSIASRFNSLWGATRPLPSQRSNSETSESNTARHTGQLTGSAAIYPVPELSFRHRAAKSTSSNISVTSQPVLVRTYTRLNGSRPLSAGPSVNAGAQSMTAAANLPSVDAFSFDGILRAIEPEIHEAIDGIAEIYARSKLSLADDYDAHLSPQGQAAAPRMRYSGLAIRTAGLERTLTTVTEASSSSERLLSGSRANSVASGKGKATAYGSLRSIMSRGRSSSHSSAPPDMPTRPRLAPSAWSIAGENEHYITLKRQNTAPMHLSLASVAEIPRDKNADQHDAAVEPSPTARRRPAWLSWRGSWAGETSGSRSLGRLDAKGSLKSVLQNNGQESGASI